MLEITGLCQNIEDENNNKNIFIDIEVEQLLEKEIITGKIKNLLRQMR